MSVISTEVEFTLPIGYRDGDGNLHRQGVMRLATAGDEILPLKDHRVQANPAYLSVIVLSVRVILESTASAWRPITVLLVSEMSP